MAGTYAYGLGGAGPHAVSQVGAKLYSYDANGAMVSGDGKTTTWTSFNKPRKIEDTLTGDKAEFVYGPGRARIKQQIVDNSLLTDVIYVGSLFEKKIHPGDDDELVHYIRAGGAVVAIYTRYDDGYGFTDKTRYLHRDHLGSVESVTDEAGTVTERTSYDPHGKRRLADWQAGTPTTPGETPRGFTGHEHLDAVGLIHMNGRVYDPTLGRFLSADPFVMYPETTQGFNRYSYTDNNPLSYTDPSGFRIENHDGSIAEKPNGRPGNPKSDPQNYDGHDGRTHKDKMEMGSGGPVPSSGIDWDGSARQKSLDGAYNWGKRNGLTIGYRDLFPDYKNPDVRAYEQYEARKADWDPRKSQVTVVPVAVIGGLIVWDAVVGGAVVTVGGAAVVNEATGGGLLGGWTIGEALGDLVHSESAKEPEAPKEGERPEVPAVDSTGKVHGELPHPKDFDKYDPDELEHLKDDLEVSVEERINKTSELGSDPGHGRRQQQEQDLIQQIDKYLGGS